MVKRIDVGCNRKENYMKLELNNKRVLVTGASKGIGLAIATTFLEEQAQVCIISRGLEDLLETKKNLQNQYGEENIIAEQCNCVESEELNSLKNLIKEKWNGLDIVVVNVGSGDSTSDSLPDDKKWKETWGNNFESALQTARIFIPMLEKSNGVLLFVSSIAGVESIGAPTDYSTAKSAVISLAKNLSKKLAPSVRVNVIAPGNIYFEGGSWDKKLQENGEKVNEMIHEKVPMKSFGKPEDIANAVAFLCSERAKFITGTTLVVDGGQTSGLL
tara:strand:+ start:1524 stop:2342 length:819 start_codon:yes stop_codon:yes gene_type:complete